MLILTHYHHTSVSFLYALSPNFSIASNDFVAEMRAEEKMVKKWELLVKKIVTLQELKAKYLKK